MVCQQEFKKPPFLQFLVDPVKMTFETIDRFRSPLKTAPNSIKAITTALDLFYWSQATDSNSLKAAMVEYINGVEVYGKKILEMSGDENKAWYEAFKGLCDAFYDLIIEYREFGYIWQGKKNGGNAEAHWK